MTVKYSSIKPATFGLLPSLVAQCCRVLTRILGLSQRTENHTLMNHAFSDTRRGTALSKPFSIPNGNQNALLKEHLSLSVYH